MSKNSTPGVPGQDPTSTDNTNPESDLAKILAAIREISTRIDVLEQRFEYLDRDVLKAIDAESEAVADAEPDPPRVPSIALSIDGRVLLSLAYLNGIPLGGRETWTGLVLTEAEACDIRDRIEDGADDAAAHIGGRLIALAKKKADKGEGDNGDG